MVLEQVADASAVLLKAGFVAKRMHLAVDASDDFPTCWSLDEPQVYAAQLDGIQIE